MYFETNGSKKTGNYDVYLFLSKQPRLQIGAVKENKRNGLKQARIMICQYLLNKMKTPHDFIFNQYCVSPDRAEHKNVWEQWKVSDYI